MLIKFLHIKLSFNKLDQIYLLKVNMAHINLSLNQKYTKAVINSTMMIHMISVVEGSVEGRGKMKEIKNNFKSSE